MLQPCTQKPAPSNIKLENFPTTVTQGWVTIFDVYSSLKLLNPNVYVGADYDTPI